MAGGYEVTASLYKLVVLHVSDFSDVGFFGFGLAVVAG
jgi:hypothetical protein